LLVGLGVVGALGRMATGLGYWPDALAAVNSTGVIVAAMAAGLAAWVGGRERRRRLAYLRASATIPSWWMALAEVLAVLVWVTVAYLVVLAIVAGRVVTLHPNGRFGLAFAAVTWLGIAVFTVLGYGLGRGLSSRFVPLLAAVVPYGLYLVNSDRSGRPWYLLFPFLDEIVPVYDPPQRGLHDRQVLWLGGVLLLTVGVALGRRLSRRGLAVVLVPGLLLAATGAALLLPYGGRFHPREVAAYPYTCSSGRVEICVHPAFKRALPQLQPRFDALAAVLQKTPAAFTRLEQRPRGVGAEPSPGATAIHLDDLRPSFALQAQDEFVTDLLDVDACFKQDTEELGFFLTQLVHRWLVAPADVATGPPQAEVDSYERARRFLTGARAEQVQLWLSRHYQLFTTCSLTAADFR
jgi:hypothetical protein